MSDDSTIPDNTASTLTLTQENGAVYIHTPVDPDRDFIVGDDTDLRQYEAARKAGKRIVSVDAQTGKVRSTLAAWLAQDPNRISLIHADILRANKGIGG
ncbi:MAG TPA: hypothetical protein VGN75_03920 [Kaistia sp.]|jgi:hypothetical protein|nr:hypothetical protein [Kaistia sp.]